MSGLVKVHRSILDWEWYDDLNTRTLFLHLLLTVNVEPKKWRGIDIDTGQRFTTLGALSNETGLSVQSIRTSLGKLKSTGEITDVQRARGRMITVVGHRVHDFIKMANEHSEA